MSARKLGSYLNEPTSPLSRLNAAAQRIRAFAHIWESVAPIELTRYCRVGRIDEDVLTLYADNGAIATKLNQQLPSLLEKFRKRGGKITGIRIAVQVKQPLTQPKASAKPGISPVAYSQLEAFSSGLEDSPLKLALTNLLKSQDYLKEKNSTYGESGPHDQEQHQGKFK